MIRFKKPWFSYWLIGMLILISVLLTHTFFMSSAHAETTNKVNLSPLFIELSDAMAAQKKGDEAKVQEHLAQIKEDFYAIDTHDSPAGQAVESLIGTAQQQPTTDNLTNLSKSLLVFETEQNPVDYGVLQAKFAKNMQSAYDNLAKKIQAADLNTEAGIRSAKSAYKQFNLLWMSNERVVKDTSMSHYGKIEMAMALLRTGIESNPPNREKINTQLAALKQVIDDYVALDVSQSNSMLQSTQAASQGNYELNDGIALLQEGLSAYQSGQIQAGDDKLTQFIEIWASIESEVSTRNASLYNRLESQIPVILANGGDIKNQQKLQALIDELKQINPQASYTAIDAMFILLREGLEALLIVMALVSALKAAKQPKGVKWVWGGVAAGLFASILTALALQQLFPAVSSGRNREMLEGFVGIFAVVMMIGIGLWLHSKSSVANWQKFIKKHTGAAVATGSFLPMFGLSFLSVFREGAETILFYVGILPQISLGQFFLGIALAAIVLLVVAVIMLKTSLKLPIPIMFKILTWLIYVLGFKMLGVSIHALQLTNYLPTTTIASLPSIEWLGIYPTMQTLMMQLSYIVIIIVLQVWLKQRELKASH